MEMTLMVSVLRDVLCSLVKSSQHFKGTCHSSLQCRPCSLAENCQCFGETQCLHLQSLPNRWGMFL